MRDKESGNKFHSLIAYRGDSLSKIEENIEKLVESKINELGYELYDVEYAKEGKDYFLRIFIDSSKGIDLEDCEKVSKEINELIDNSNYIANQYFLEVSSPGIERVLRKDKHLKQNIGKLVEIKLFKAYMGKKIIEGILNNYDDACIYLEQGEIVKIDRKDISIIKIKYEW